MCIIYISSISYQDSVVSIEIRATLSYYVEQVINIYIKNNSGPYTDPWGTPHVIKGGSELVPLMQVVCDLFSKYFFCEIFDIISNTNFVYFFSRISWFTVSKAFEKSIKVAIEIWLLLMAS